MAIDAFTPPTKQAEAWTVSQLTRRVKGLLEETIGTIWVSGEISNWRVSPAGHAYFTLKDEKSQLSAVMFKGRISRLVFEPEAGLEVILRGQVTVYEQRGQYQMICEAMQPKGVGALQLAFEKLKAKLSDEGLFDEALKKPLPLLPKRIGVVTSPTGAAIRDILNVIERRFANVHVMLYPARVQGDEAAPEIVEGIETLDAYGVDVMIVGRGGGSLEDLWPFNEESVVRAVFACETPVISAVGHEIDYTLCDLVADVRAPTPSAAAELVVQEHEALVESVSTLQARLGRAMSGRLALYRARLDGAASSFIFRRPEELLREWRQRTDESRMTLEREMQSRIETERHRTERALRSLALLSPANQVRRTTETFRALVQRLHLGGKNMIESQRAHFHPLVAQLDALSPLAILSRGYSVAWKMPEEELVRDAGQLSPKDTVKLKFGKGGASATVDSIDSE